MKRSHIQHGGPARYAYAAAVFLSFVLAAPLHSQNAASPVKLAPSSFRWGTDVRARNHMNMNLQFSVENSLDSPFQGIITVLPEQIPTNQMVITQNELDVGPNAILQDVTHQPACRTSEFMVKIADRNGNILDQTAIPAIFDSPYYRRFVFLVTSNLDLAGISDLAKNSQLLDRLVATRSNPFEMPHLWQLYNPASIINLHDIELADTTRSQLQAIRDFVSGGGTLLITSPNTIQAVADSPLADLLPADILGTRPVATMPELAEWSRAHRTPAGNPIPAPVWDRGIDLAELAPRDRAIVPLTHSDLPLLCWRRHGNGWVGVTAFDAWDPTLVNSGGNLPVWNHFLAWSGDHPLAIGMIHSQQLENAVQRLSGFQAADSHTVHRILLINAMIVIIILTCGILVRRQAWAWTFLTLYGIGIAVWIFHAAQKQASTQAPRTVVVLDFESTTPHGGGRAMLLSFFSRSNEAPTLTGTTHKVVFHPPRPPLNRSILAAFQQPQEGGSILLVESRHGIQRCQDFRVRALMPRAVGAFTPANPNKEQTPNITLHIDENGPRLTGDGLAPEPDEHWYLALGNGVTPCRIVETQDGFGLTARFNADRAFNPDPVLHEFEKFLQQAPLQRNTLIRLRRAREENLAALPVKTDEDFHPIHYRFTMYPVQELVDPGIFRIAPQQIPTMPANRSTQSTMAYDDMLMLRSDREELLFAASLPPSLAGMTPRTVEVDLSIIDPSGQISVKPNLYTAPVLGEGAVPVAGSPNTLIAPTSQDGRRFTFIVPKDTRLQDPVTGRFFLQVVVEKRRAEAVEIKPQSSMADAGSPWQFQSLKIAVTGTAPPKNGASHVETP